MVKTYVDCPKTQQDQGGRVIPKDHRHDGPDVGDQKYQTMLQEYREDNHDTQLGSVAIGFGIGNSIVVEDTPPCHLSYHIGDHACLCEKLQKYNVFVSHCSKPVHGEPAVG